MALAALFSKFKLRYKDPQQEREYRLLKIPLLKDFFMCLFVCIALYYIPLTARYFAKNLYPQSYIGIALFVIALILLIFRVKLTRCLEIISLVYVAIIIAIGIVNVREIIPKSSYEYFYMGYNFALVHRLIDYRVVKFHVVLLFNITFTILKFTLIEMPDVIIALNIVCLEIFPIVLTYMTERGDRSLFDSVYKSKQELLKFKNFLTDYLPNQMAIFSSDYSCCYFVNDSFKKMFKYEGLPQLKNFLQKFVMEEADIEKNKFFLARIGAKSSHNSTIGLSDFLDLLTSQVNIIKTFKGISFQVIETSAPQDKSRSSRIVSPNPSSDSKLESNGIFSSLRKKLGNPENKKKQEISTDNNHNNKKKQKVPSNEDHNLYSQKNDSQGDNLIDEPEQNNGNPNEGFDSDQKSPDSPRRKVLKVKIFPIIWDSHDAIALVIDDVTHERTIMELKIADKNKDLVIATISHELRTPLNGMLGLINIVEKRLKQSDVLPYLEACKHSSLLLLSLVNSILDLSQIKKNKLKLNYSEVSLENLLFETKALFGSFCQSKGLYFNIEMEPGIPEKFMTDAGRVTQILVNLIGNAFKFTYKGGITLKAKLEVRNPCKIKLSVEDTGIGIKKDDQEKLFRMFSRIEHKDRTLNTQGVGLGLSISYSLAEILNPSDPSGIEVQSHFGKGSIFSFYIEELQQDDNTIQEVESENFGAEDSTVMGENIGTMSVVDKIATYTDTKDKAGLSRRDTLERDPKMECFRREPYLEKPWCLIVDDNPFNLMVANHIMEERGYRVENAMNGKEAIQKFQFHESSGRKFKLVLMDCQMPIMDGYEATKILKNMMKEGKLKYCPIIALTANTRNEKHEKLYDEAGMNGYVPKPLQIRELDEVLKEVLKNKRKERSS